MHDYDQAEELRMTRFLLGELPDVEREHIARRLADDDAYFQAMAAFEDDLVLRFARGQLGPELHQAFEQRYRQSPARWAMVEESQALLAEASAWRLRRDARPWRRIGRWLAAPSGVPRLTLAAAGVALIVAASVATHVVARQRGSPGAHVVATFMLTATGERGQTPAQTMDRVRIAPEVAEVRLMLEVDETRPDGNLEVELGMLDSGVAEQPANVRVDRTATGAIVTASIAARALRDGDYVLTVRRRAGEQVEIVARRALRVTRLE